MDFIDIEIGGKVRTLRFGIRPIGRCIKHFNNDIGEFFKTTATNPFEAVPLLFFYGLEWGAEEKGQPVDFTQVDVLKWIEQLDGRLQSPVVEQVIQSFTRSVYDNVPAVKVVVDALDEDVKKNLIGTLM